MFSEVSQHRRASRVEPRITVVGESRLLRVGHQASAFVVGDPIAGARLDQRQVLGPHCPQRSAHGEVLDQRAALIEFGVQIGDGEAGQSRPQRQIRGGRVGGMQPDEIRHHTVDRIRAHRQKVAPRQPRPPFRNLE